MVNIFARSDRERAPIALLAKCEPIFKRFAFEWVRYGSTSRQKKKHTPLGWFS